jgi:hypothetical protein
VLGLWAADTTQQVGPGTGLAPFRSFILHRLVAAGKLPHSGVGAGSDSSASLGEAYGEMVLFFGCRRPDQVSEWVGARVRVRVASPCLHAWHEAARPHALCQGSTTTAGRSPLPGARIFVLTARKRAAPRAPAPPSNAREKRRRHAQDYLYGRDLEGWAAAGHITLHTAFSRVPVSVPRGKARLGGTETAAGGRMEPVALAAVHECQRDGKGIWSACLGMTACSF